MLELVTSIGKLAIGFLCILGPVVLLMAFLHSREKREAEIRTRVLQELNSPELRGLFFVTVQSRLVGADTVVVDLWGCSREQVWDLMERLSDRLGDRARVEVNGVSGSRVNSKWTLKFRKGPAVAHCCG
jgi:hypothetical protein